MKKFTAKKITAVLLLALALMAASLSACIEASAAPSPASYKDMKDVYYTKAGCIVYSQPSYTSPVIVTLDENLPVQVIGSYSNGWYRINIGVIGYVKFDAVTTAGAIGLPTNPSAQVNDAQRIATEMGYEFVNLKLNNEKKIKKDVYNSYIGQKVLLYAKVDDEVGVSFKMLYEDKIKSDIDLNFSKTVLTNSPGKRTIKISFPNGASMQLLGQIAIFQFKSGCDMKVRTFTKDLTTGALNTQMPMHQDAYYTEFSEFAYAPMTQIADMQIEMQEVSFSLTETKRADMINLQRGIKYMHYDNQSYMDSIKNLNTTDSQKRLDTEYVDYYYDEDDDW